MNKKYLILAVGVIVVGASFLLSKLPVSAPVVKEIIYTNNEYGFKITLPSTWAGYGVLDGKREVRDVSTGAVVSVAPTISIRHPLWTKQIPRQDIPVDIYTLSEWAGIKAEKYSVGAAPIPPSELARNAQYVFALPARYNFAYLEGYKEVEEILINKPVAALELGFVYKNSNADLIQVSLPYPNAVVGKTFSVLGKARGSWFFEASFPVVLMDKDNKELARGVAKAQGDPAGGGVNWMTTEFVPFKADLKVLNQNYIGKGTLVLMKDNPSGDKARDASVSFGINVEY